MKTKITTGLFSVCLVAACSGSGGGSSPPPPPPSGTAEGLWAGTTSTNRTVTGLVLDDGVYYVLYSVANNPNLIAGVVQGNGTSLNGSFSSSNARDFNLEGLGVLSGTVSASYVTRQSLNGTVTYDAGGAVTFTTSFNSAYDITPSLSDLAGTYSGQSSSSAGVENVSVTITTSGSFSGTSSGGCSFSGSAAARIKGNAYNISITFGASPCLHAGQSFAGIGYYDSPSKRLYAAAPNSTRTTGVLFVGTKP